MAAPRGATSRRWRFDPDAMRYAMRRAGYGRYGGAGALARDVGVARDAIGDYLDGTRSPSVPALFSLAEALECDPADLVEDTWAR